MLRILSSKPSVSQSREVNRCPRHFTEAVARCSHSLPCCVRDEHIVWMFTLTAHITPFPNWKVEVKGSGFSASHLLFVCFFVVFLTLLCYPQKRMFLYLPGTETLTLLQGASCEYFRRDDMCHPEAICFSGIQIPVSFSGNPPCESSKPAAGLRRGTCLMKSRWIGNRRQVVRFTEWCQLWSRHNRICNEVICNLIILRVAQGSLFQSPETKTASPGTGGRVCGSCYRAAVETAGRSPAWAEERKPRRAKPGLAD